MSVEAVFDAIFERDSAEGHCSPALFDSITDELAACSGDDERDAMMKSILDRLFYQPGILSHQIQGLKARPELNGSAVQVMGPLKHGTSLRYPVKVMNLHAPFHGEQLLVKPQNLHILLVRPDGPEATDCGPMAKASRYRYSCPLQLRPQELRAHLCQVCDELGAYEYLTEVHLLELDIAQGRLSLAYEDELLVRLRSVLLRHASRLEILFITDAVASTELLRALDTSNIWKLHVELNSDSRGAAHLCDSSAWQTLDDILYLCIDCGRHAWTNAQLSSFWEMGDASSVLPFTCISMGDHEGLVPFDESLLSTIASRCPNLEKIELQGPALHEGAQPPDVGEGLLDLAEQCPLCHISLRHLPVSTTKLFKLFKIANELEHIQVGFSLVDTGQVDEIISNRPPDADPIYRQPDLIQHMGELLADSGRIKELYLHDLDCNQWEVGFTASPEIDGVKRRAMPRALSEMVEVLLHGDTAHLETVDFDFNHLSGEEYEHAEEELDRIEGELVEELREAYGDRLRVCPGSFGGQETPWYDVEDREWYE